MSRFACRTSYATNLSSIISQTLRKYATVPSVPKEEGDISGAFVSLSGVQVEPLPRRFADLKRRLVHDHKEQLTASWNRLLRELQNEIQEIKVHGSNIIPDIQFKDIGVSSANFEQAVHKRGVAIIRGVVPQTEAREYKNEVERYIKDNPSTKGKQTT